MMLAFVVLALGVVIRRGEPAPATAGNATGRTKALLVAFQYSGRNQLDGVCTDLKHMRRWVRKHQFADVAVLTDWCRRRGVRSKAVSKQHMLERFAWLLEGASAGDTLLFYYSGHGGHEKDKEPLDECSGSDETLIPPKGPTLTDDEIFNHLVAKVPVGVHLFAIVDACHSGTVLDLPWNWHHVKYLETAEKEHPAENIDAFKFSSDQFDWEWRSPAKDLGRAYPLAGTVTLISGSQNWQYSRDKGMAGGGLMTDVLVTKHRTRFHKLHPLYCSPHRAFHDKSCSEEWQPVLTTALKEKWSYAKTMATVIDHVTNGIVKVSSSFHSRTKQIPNFSTSHRFNMDAPISLAAITPLAGDEGEGQCTK